MFVQPLGSFPKLPMSEIKEKHFDIYYMYFHSNCKKIMLEDTNNQEP
jgi:hypothetical protein